jgi:hypothetical protein
MGPRSVLLSVAQQEEPVISFEWPAAASDAAVVVLPPRPPILAPHNSLNIMLKEQELEQQKEQESPKVHPPFSIFEDQGNTALL